MFCIQCGAKLPTGAKFCHQCGAAQASAQASAQEKRQCVIRFRQVGEKWSLFGKELWRFEAIGEDKTAAAVSVTITITGFELYGPNENNRKHKKAFDQLVEKLLADGWIKNGKQGEQWYEEGFSIS